MEKQLGLEHRLTEVEERSKSNTKRIDRIQKRQDDLEKLVEAVGEIKVEMKHNRSDLDEIKTDVKALANKGSKRWDSVTEKVIMLVVAAVVGWFLAHFGL